MTALKADRRAPMRVDALQEALGQIVGVSSWIAVEQPRIDDFAAVTEDHQFIHVDVAAAAASPFGGTIAHGFLTLSLLSRMAQTGLAPIEGTSASLNYGFDRVRFLTPVPSGARIRGRFTLAAVTRRAPEQVLVRYQVEVEIEGNPRPALSADWLVLALIDNKETV